MRAWVTTGIEVVGLAMIAVAAGAHDVTAGIALGGVFLVGVGALEGRKQ